MVRQDGLWPFLLVRSFLGDTGQRPNLTRMLFQSPDIMLLEGNFQLPDAGQPVSQLKVGTLYTAFVHVWNLGRLPAIGANLSLHQQQQTGPLQPLSARYFNLPDARDPGCHQTIRLPALFRPMTAGSVRLLARVDSMMDLCGPEMNDHANRHVAGRTFVVHA